MSVLEREIVANLVCRSTEVSARHTKPLEIKHVEHSHVWPPPAWRMVQARVRNHSIPFLIANIFAISQILKF